MRWLQIWRIDNSELSCAFNLLHYEISPPRSTSQSIRGLLSLLWSDYSVDCLAERPRLWYRFTFHLVLSWSWSWPHHRSCKSILHEDDDLLPVSAARILLGRLNSRGGLLCCIRLYLQSSRPSVLQGLHKRREKNDCCGFWGPEI